MLVNSALETQRQSSKSLKAAWAAQRSPVSESKICFLLLILLFQIEAGYHTLITSNTQNHLTLNGLSMTWPTSMAAHPICALNSPAEFNRTGISVLI